MGLRKGEVRSILETGTKFFRSAKEIIITNVIGDRVEYKYPDPRKLGIRDNAFDREIDYVIKHTLPTTHKALEQFDKELEELIKC